MLGEHNMKCIFNSCTGEWPWTVQEHMNPHMYTPPTPQYYSTVTAGTLILIIIYHTVKDLINALIESFL